MHASRPTVLLTGFGPFPGVGANATTLLVPRLAEAAARTFPGMRIAYDVLPTEWSAGPARALRLYGEHRPALALHFGVSSRARGFEIETRARNRCQASPDAAGLLPPLDLLSPEGPETLPAQVPAAYIVARLRRRGLPASLSRDAGGYLCNALLYRALELGRDLPDPPRAGFIHLPASLVHERFPTRGPVPGAPLDWEGVVEGGLEIIAASLGRPPPQPARV